MTSFRHNAATSPDSLDAAWAEAEAMLPDDPEWGGPSVYRYDNLDGNGPYGASASPPGDKGLDGIYGYGSTPAAALRALIDALRERDAHP